MGVLIMVAQLILSLSILVVLHEGGHFFPAKLFGCRVEKFYLFFDPYFSLFKFKKGETEYGVGWLPLGGYVKIAGMIDESFDKEQMAQEPQPWEFRSKPAWQRLIIMLGGVTVNFLLGILIWSMVLFKWGSDYLPPENAVYGIEVDSMAQAVGLRAGDILVGVNNEPTTNFNAFRRDIIIKEATTIQVVRNKQQVDVPLSKDHLTELAGYRGRFAVPRFPFKIDTIFPEMPAQKAGFKKGDVIIGLDNKQIDFYSDFLKLIKDYKAKTINIAVQRQSDTLQLTTTVSKEGKIGTRVIPLEESLKFETQQYGLAESFPAGYKKSMGALGDMIKSFGLMFKGTVKAKDSLGSFITIGKLFSPRWDWRRFWSLTALLSLILAFMNILPIPLLDGGHVMFLLYEMIAGRPPNERFQEYAQLVGMVLLVSLMAFALGLDVARHFGWI